MKPPPQTLIVQKKRKRAKRLLWTTRNRYRQAVVRRVLHLPTRRTLTYAEAQQFVDVCINGSISRLNVLEPLSVVDEQDSEKYDSECCTVSLPSEPSSGLYSVSLPSETTNGVDSSLYEQTLNNSRQVQVLSLATATTMPLRPAAYYRHVDETPEELSKQVEYDTDEQVCVFFGFI